VLRRLISFVAPDGPATRNNSCSIIENFQGRGTEPLGPRQPHAGRGHQGPAATWELRRNLMHQVLPARRQHGRHFSSPAQKMMGSHHRASATSRDMLLLCMKLLRSFSLGTWCGFPVPQLRITDLSCVPCWLHYKSFSAHCQRHAGLAASAVKQSAWKDHHRCRAARGCATL
jgi:hypothetical protein